MLHTLYGQAMKHNCQFFGARPHLSRPRHVACCLWRPSCAACCVLAAGTQRWSTPARPHHDVQGPSWAELVLCLGGGQQCPRKHSLRLLWDPASLVSAQALSRSVHSQRSGVLTQNLIVIEQALFCGVVALTTPLCLTVPTRFFSPSNPTP
jgi:hypothetical protein